MVSCVIDVMVDQQFLTGGYIDVHGQQQYRPFMKTNVHLETLTWPNVYVTVPKIDLLYFLFVQLCILFGAYFLEPLGCNH